jgi:hypothetical protein
MSQFGAPKLVFCPAVGDRAGWGMRKIELPDGWAGVAEPLRALLAEVEHAAHEDRTAPADFAVVSAQWAKVSDAIRATVRARILEAQAGQASKQ